MKRTDDSHQTLGRPHSLWTPRFYGWVPREEKDPRDWVYEPPRGLMRSAPRKCDLSSGMGPQLDQEDIGSCGPNTSRELIDFDQRAEKHPAVPPSRLFIYYVTRALMGSRYIRQDSGVDNFTMLKALNKYGYCSESMLPYDTARFTQKPSQACYKAALPFAIRNYAVVRQTLADMKATIASGFPFCFGFSCFPEIESASVARTGILPDPKKHESTIGGHDVSIVGYDDDGFGKIRGGCFKFRNHWLNADGSPWDDRGYGYLSYAYATNPSYAGDFFVINAVN